MEKGRKTTVPLIDGTGEYSCCSTWLWSVTKTSSPISYLDIAEARRPCSDYAFLLRVTQTKCTYSPNRERTESPDKGLSVRSPFSISDLCASPHISAFARSRRPAPRAEFGMASGMVALRLLKRHFLLPPDGFPYLQWRWRRPPPVDCPSARLFFSTDSINPEGAPWRSI